MQIEFVGHASVVLRRGPIHLLVDPWLEGRVFDDGWALLSRPVFGPADFDSITHLWFSHEHPDHFHPRTLAAIPEAARRRIQVLFHPSGDGKVVEHCRGLGFGEVRELPLGCWQSLGAGFEVFVDTWAGSDDSWMALRTPEGTVLNLNDCAVVEREEARELARRIGSVDALLTQFSISAWDGGEHEVERRRAGARAMLERVLMQTEVLGARHVVPFASFVRFCHRENAYMNGAMVDVSQVAEALAQQGLAQPVVMYPGDRWELGHPWNSEPAATRYARDRAALAGEPLVESPPVDLETLAHLAERFQARIYSGRKKVRRRLSAARNHVRHLRRRHTLLAGLQAAAQMLLLRPRPAHLWLSDHGRAVTLCPLKGFSLTDRGRKTCDLELSSSALAYALKFLWGGETLQINGRFRELEPDGRFPLFDQLWLAATLNHRAGALARPL